MSSLRSAERLGVSRATSDWEDQRQVMRDLLADLPGEQAEALALRVVLGWWSLEEVARAYGIPTNTVRSRVRLAKEAPRRRIEATPGLVEMLALEP
jgi:DNA-directed RNA polymerase specialized sigma24 family protein